MFNLIELQINLLNYFIKNVKLTEIKFCELQLRQKIYYTNLNFFEYKIMEAAVRPNVKSFHLMIVSVVSFSTYVALLHFLHLSRKFFYFSLYFYSDMAN